jgi:D-alanyl-D-alanine carboxypeptidase
VLADAALAGAAPAPGDAGAADDAALPLRAEAEEVAGESLDAAPLATPPRHADTAPAAIDLARVEPETFPDTPRKPVVVTRLSTSGGRHWGINVGTYNSQYEAEKVLLKTALVEIDTLDEALRKVARGKTGFEANFVGMTQDMAELACRRLTARNRPCTTLGPAS